jgi:hypothetical protein
LPGAAEQVAERHGPVRRRPGGLLGGYLTESLPQIGDGVVEVPRAWRIPLDQIRREPEFFQGCSLARAGIGDPDRAPAIFEPVEICTPPPPEVMPGRFIMASGSDIPGVAGSPCLSGTLRR